MASTNKTTHYELSQYVGSDKPTYLVDYNTDMANIDTGIYNAQGKADTNATSIGTLSNLDTTVKTDLVSAINEVEGEATTNTTNIGNLSNLTTEANTSLVAAINEVDGNSTTNNQNIGNMANLETTVKSSLVGAVNELKGVNDTQNTAISNNTARIENFNLTSTESITTATVSSGTGSIDSVNITVAKNSDGSLAKIYGNINTKNSVTAVEIQTSLRPTEQITVSNVAFRYRSDTGAMNFQSITLYTNGKVRIAVNSSVNCLVQLIPVLIYVKNFGDVPSQ